ncbi:MAG: conjugal transfer protein TraF [Labilithrix sp.]|nr:conjugal transfer protein TraF [Labilithrix sp.]MCW5815448.1 conjugal transfer protein TraF [Labilithrix sp.]
MHIFGGGGARGKAAPAGGGGPIATVTERDFEQVVLLAETPVLVQFTSDRSQACKQIAPEVEAFAAEMEGKVKVVRLDIDQSPGLARQLRLQGVPTFMLFAEQRLADAQVGPLGKKQLKAMVEPFLPRSAGALKARELAELIKQGVVTPVDVRDAAAYGRAHLPGAKSLPFEEIEGRLAELYMLPGQPALYDRAGDKVKELAAQMTEQGTPVAFLEGGILAWESEGLPVERP